MARGRKSVAGKLRIMQVATLGRSSCEDQIVKLVAKTSLHRQGKERAAAFEGIPYTMPAGS